MVNLLRYLTLLSVIFLLIFQIGVKAQDSDAIVEEIFNALSPQERIGQLFLVSFNGNNVGPDSDIAELIQEYRIGGVILSASSRNFVNDGDTPQQVMDLTSNLQILAQNPIVSPTLTSTVVIANPIPLFIAVGHEGDGFPNTQIRNGLPEPPSQMALAATWNTENARQVGEAVGRNLSDLGINMLFGPSLDVLDTPRPNQGNGLAVRTFGGNPFWVGEMGSAYIQGVHQGSSNRLLTIAKHFPGFGSSDREINKGVPTILKSLDDLRRVELSPFFQVTNIGGAAPEGITDGVMTAHARYQGLQGNVPISMDARNLPALLALKEIAPWRQAGGLVVSGPLGAPASLEGIVASGDAFPARRLALESLSAGNDVLQLVDFAFVDGDPDLQSENIKDAITFFQERYNSDPNFQAVVDQRVRRIIAAKVKIFGDDLLNAPTRPELDTLEQSDAAPLDLGQIAQAAVTLIKPVPQGGVAPLPEAPQPNENILIFMDDRVGQDCTDCPEFSFIPTTALEDRILELFGPDATGQVNPAQINSLSFSALKESLLEDDVEGADETRALIDDADWILFGMLNIDVDKVPQSDAVRALLRSRYDTLRNKKLVLFAFNAPYFLDETEISQLTVFYGLYSKSPEYLEAAARVLFQQFEPSGASPVAIPAISPLNLNPDPNQLIELNPTARIDSSGGVVPIESVPENGSIDLEVGEGILFKTGVIVDKNGNPVPDGTVVDFFRYYPLEGLSLEPVQSRTADGIAEITIIKERDTPLQVRASSNLAVQSVTFNIGPGIVDTPTPTPTFTPMPTATWTPTPVPTFTATSEPTLTLTPEPTPTLVPASIAEPQFPGHPVSYIDLIYSLLGAALIALIAFTLGGDRFPLEERVRSALVPLAAGLVGYIFFTIFAITIPESQYVQLLIRQGTAGHWVAPLVSLLFAVTGLFVWILKPGRVFWKDAS